MDSYSNYKIEMISSKYITQKIFDNLHKKRALQIIKYNRKIQIKLEKDINDFKESSELYSSIEIEIIPAKNKLGKFINIFNKQKYESYYHIYFNDSKEEMKKYSIDKNDNIKKIKIIIDYKIKSFCKLFYYCDCIQSTYFKKFFRNNIHNMSYMFFGCKSLTELNLSNFITNEVVDMNNMFARCISLKELNLYNFDTHNVTDMSFMFDGCSSLVKLNLYSFNTNNARNMSYMFSNCKYLKDLDITNFDLSNVTDKSGMFLGWS